MDLVAPGGGVVTGAPVLIGRLLAVPVATAAAGATFAGVVEGVFDGMVKATGTAWSQGDVLFWDDSGKKFTKSGTGNIPVGYAADDALSGDATGNVRLDPSVAPALTVTALGGSLTGSTTGTMANVSASATAGGSSPTAAQVDTAIASLATSVDLQLKELQTKLNELIGDV